VYICNVNLQQSKIDVIYDVSMWCDLILNLYNICTSTVFGIEYW
jgi:hypothetical protein